MKTRLKLYVILSVTLALGVTISISLRPASGADGTRAASSYAPQGACPSPTVPSSITAALATPPPDVCPKPNQQDMDLFSWLSFVAMNWPANTQNCTPNTQQTITNTSGLRVWETYLTNGQIVVQPSSSNPSPTPLPWCPQGSTAQAALNKELLGVPQKDRTSPDRRPVTKVFHANSKAQDDLTQHFPAIGQAVGGVLTDLNGRFVRYEIRVNKIVYTYIMQNSLWNLNGQQAFGSKPVDFQAGSIEIKAAWKVLGKNDDASKFYTVWGIVFNDDNGTPSPGPNPVQLGLVGLHIITKTPNQPFWIWSTFEHVNNAPVQGETGTGQKFNFYNIPNCSPLPCATPNEQTADSNDPSELGSNGQPLVKPAQVSRVNPIDNAPTALNQTFQSLLAGSVWANYALVSTQWTVNATDPDYTHLKLVPGWLANMTMETYNQGPNPPVDLFPAPTGTGVFNPYNPDLDYRAQYQPFDTAVSSSCLKCHRTSHTGVKVPGENYKYPADFSFILGGAKPLASSR